MVAKPMRFPESVTRSLKRLKEVNVGLMVLDVICPSAGTYQSLPYQCPSCMRSFQTMRDVVFESRPLSENPPQSESDARHLALSRVCRCGARFAVTKRCERGESGMHKVRREIFEFIVAQTKEHSPDLEESAIRQALREMLRLNLAV